jgi:non-ribosomal peptide synthetase component F
MPPGGLLRNVGGAEIERPATLRGVAGQSACRREYIAGYTQLTMRHRDSLAYCRAVTSADPRGTAVIRAVPDVGPLPPVTVTQRLISASAAYGARTALAGASPGAQFSFADLASTVQRAAAGLAWRGLRPRDVVGVYVPDAVCYILACHAIRAAGGIPSPLSTGLSVPEMAGQLADCGARMLLTSQPLATAALAASDRSWVRQVISFGEAPAATPFDSLLAMGSMPPPGARPHELALLPYVRQPDGTLRASGQTHVTVTAELSVLAATAGLGPQDVVLATPPTGDGRSYAVYLDHALLSGATVVAAGPGELDAAADEHRGTAAVIPLGVAVPGTSPLRLFTVAS